MEIVDVYTLNREKTSKTVVRGSKLDDGEFRSVVHACVFNSNNQLLIQKRLDDGNKWSGLWDISMGGGVLAGETPQEACKRELKEELGIDVDTKGIRPRLTINFEKGFDDYFLFDKDIDLKDLVLQEDEVADAKWASNEEIKQLIRSGSFISYHESLIDLLFDMRKGYSAFSKKY